MDDLVKFPIPLVQESFSCDSVLTLTSPHLSRLSGRITSSRRFRHCTLSFVAILSSNLLFKLLS